MTDQRSIPAHLTSLMRHFDDLRDGVHGNAVSRRDKEAHHPHLRGGTVGDWPLNVFSLRDATDQLPILRAIATSDLHNLVFQSDYRIIPAVTNPSVPRLG